jgi:hypothetical protein
MALWKKKEKKGIRSEDWFYEFLQELTPIEMLNLTKAMVKVMKDMNTLSKNASDLMKDDRKEIY